MTHWSGQCLFKAFVGEGSGFRGEKAGFIKHPPRASVSIINKSQSSAVEANIYGPFAVGSYPSHLHWSLGVSELKYPFKLRLYLPDSDHVQTLSPQSRRVS